MFDGKSKRPARIPSSPKGDGPLRKNLWVTFEWFRGAHGAPDSSRFAIWIVPDPNPNPNPHPDDTSEWCYTYRKEQEYGPLDGSEDAAVEKFLSGKFREVAP